MFEVSAELLRVLFSNKLLESFGIRLKNGDKKYPTLGGIGLNYLNIYLDHLQFFAMYYVDIL